MMMKSYISSALIALTVVFSVGLSSLHAAEDSVNNSDDPLLSSPLDWTAENAQEEIPAVPLMREQLVMNNVETTDAPKNPLNVSGTVLRAYQQSALVQIALTSLYQDSIKKEREQNERAYALKKKKQKTVRTIAQKNTHTTATYAIATESAPIPTSNTKAVKVMRVLATAYSSTVDQTDSSPCTTANGFNVCKNNQENVVAANFLPFGTKIRIPEMFGDRVFTVHDRMARRFSDRVDVWMKTRESAMKFGVRTIKIEVLEY